MTLDKQVDPFTTSFISFCHHDIESITGSEPTALISGVYYQFAKFYSGSCLGPFIDDVLVEDSNQCRDACQANDLCQWWTFHQDDSFCTLVTECTIKDETCTDCEFGFKTCQGGSVEGLSIPVHIVTD